MRLLSKTIRSYFLYSFIVFLLAIPLFYFIIKGILARSVDKDLITQKEELVRKLDRSMRFDPFDLLDALDPDAQLLPSPTIRLYDTLYTAKYFNRLTREVVPYRVLSSNVVIRGQYYVIELKRSLVDNESLIQSIVLVQALLLLVVGTGLVLINQRLSEQIWKPFYQTIRRMRNYRMEQDDVLRFEESKIEEFNDLNHTLQQLTERNHRVYQLQKEFTENASHEMQTPLAILQSKLDLLMQTEPLTAEQAALISNLADANGRLGRLNKSLLLLSQIENNQFPETEAVNMEEVCERTAAQLSYQTEAKNISVQTSYAGSLLVQANKSLMEVLVNNLLTNAIRYNYEGGSIRLECSGRALLVANTSHLPPLNQERLFERFHKESGQQQSIGLGLAISKKICSLYGFALRYQHHENEHIFSVSFSPGAP